MRVYATVGLQPFRLHSFEEDLDTLEAYALDGNLAPFSEMIAALVNQQLDRYLSMTEPTQGMQQSPTM